MQVDAQRGQMSAFVQPKQEGSGLKKAASPPRPRRPFTASRRKLFTSLLSFGLFIFRPRLHYQCNRVFLTQSACNYFMTRLRSQRPFVPSLPAGLWASSAPCPLLFSLRRSRYTYKWDIVPEGRRKTSFTSSPRH